MTPSALFASESLGSASTSCVPAPMPNLSLGVNHQDAVAFGTPRVIYFSQEPTRLLVLEVANLGPDTASITPTIGDTIFVHATVVLNGELKELVFPVPTPQGGNDSSILRVQLNCVVLIEIRNGGSTGSIDDFQAAIFSNQTLPCCPQKKKRRCKCKKCRKRC